MLVLVAVLLLSVGPILGLDNGLARTPPLGWLNWERFRCNRDCKNDPDNCISERLFKQIADRIADDGFKDAGYEYVIIDDCWQVDGRAANGSQLIDMERFPNGMKGLADYIHSKGLKFGIYAAAAPKTCMGYPGSQYYLQLDMQNYADWGADYVKVDACYVPLEQYDHYGYPPVAFFMNMTGRPMVLSCEYPWYQLLDKRKVKWELVAEACNMARNFNDMQDSWDGLVANVIKFYGENKGDFASHAKPGYFNDAGELVIGDFGLSYEQERAQMGMWCMMAAPLLMSVDLRNIRPASKALLLNRRLLDINQDPLGKQGIRLFKKGSVDYWTKPVIPEGSFAFAFMNFGYKGTPTKVRVRISDLGMNNSAGYNVTESFNGLFMGVFKPTDTIQVQVNPTGIFMARATIISGVNNWKKSKKNALRFKPFR